MSMTTSQQLFTLLVYSENCVGLLNQVSGIFTRRCLNIEDVAASKSSLPDITKLIITCWADRPTMEKVVKQIEKRIDVLKVCLFTDDDIVYQEIALYKVPTKVLLEEPELETIIRRHSVRILEMTPEYTVLEKAGHRWETDALRNTAPLRHTPVCALWPHLCHEVASRIYGYLPCRATAAPRRPA